MTVIAWDGRHLAADTRLTIGGSGIVQGGTSSKLAVVGEHGQAYAATGRIIESHLRAMIRWWEAGGDPAHMPPPGVGNNENIGNFIIPNINGGNCQCLSYCAPYPWDVPPPAAWGCAADYAIGAMECGADAMRAVRVACRHDHSCAEPIDFWDCKHRAFGVRRWEG